MNNLGGVLAAIFAALTLLITPSIAQDSRGHALIIANIDYPQNIGRLNNPGKDAAMIRAALAAVGFRNDDIETVIDASRGTILGAVERHAKRLRNAGSEAVGVLYYSGHGAVKPNTNRNYIIPISAGDTSSNTFWHESVPLEDIRELLTENAPNAVHIVVFDACRNELQTGQRGGGKGFVPVQDWGGMLIAYSTSPGKTASDGDPAAPAGPYAIALSEQFQMARGLSPSDLFENVRISVRTQTSGAQSPWFLHGLDKKVRFDAVDGGLSEDNGSARPPMSAEAEAWASIRESDSPGVLEAFIENFGGSIYGAFAKARLQELRSASKVASLPNNQEADNIDHCDGVEVAFGHGNRHCIKPGSGTGFKDCPLCPEMVVVPKGKFLMGETQDFGDPNNTASVGTSSSHKVYIPNPFAVGKFEITEKEWSACVDDGGCVKKATNFFCRHADCPIANLSWSVIASQYLKWLSTKTGRNYRLLSEAEWEYVARAGSKARFAFGEGVEELGEYAWFQPNSGRKAHTVGAKKRNAWGLFDVHGNLAELVEDCWNPDYGNKPQQLRMTGGAWKTGDCKFVVFRGGGWNDNAEDLGAFVRGKAPADHWGANIGFRVARSLEQ